MSTAEPARNLLGAPPLPLEASSLDRCQSAAVNWLFDHKLEIVLSCATSTTPFRFCRIKEVFERAPKPYAGCRYIPAIAHPLADMYRTASRAID